jgi:hypothetical protein
MSGGERDPAPPDAVARDGAGPPPLRPFGLVLLRDGRWSHEGQPIRNRKLRERFDRSVVYLPEEDAYVVRIGRFRGLIDVEEAGFFVRAIDPASGEIALSDGTVERLDVATLAPSPIDGALLCRVKRNLVPEGLPARFFHSAQAELLGAVEEQEGRPCVRIGGRLQPLPEGLLAAGE